MRSNYTFLSFLKARVVAIFLVVISGELPPGVGNRDRAQTDGWCVLCASQCYPIVTPAYGNHSDG